MYSNPEAGFIMLFIGEFTSLTASFLKIVFSSPEPHILLFRRPLGTDPITGKVNAELEREAKEKYAADMGECRE